MSNEALVPASGRPVSAWLLVPALLTIATVLGLLLDHYVSLTSQAMIYVLAVVIAAYVLPWGPSMVCAFAAVTALNFFFVPPRWTFEVESREHLISLATMLVVALVISHLAAALRRETGVAQLNERRARQLQALTSELADASSAAGLVWATQQALDAAFKGPSLIALQTQGDALELNADGAADVRDGMLCCMREAAVLGPGTGRWPGLNAWYLPLGVKGEVLGAVCIRNVSAADHSGREHAQALCSLLAQSLWRMKLGREIHAAQEEATRQHVQSTFLAAVSHDLRTPLAALVGAATSLQTQRDKLSAADQDKFLRSIVGEANYLSALTENTLQLVRLGSASDLHMDWQSMEEIVGAVLARVRLRDPARRIQSHVPAGLPLIKADPVLLTQLLENLLDNALKYSSDVVELEVSLADDTMRLMVRDRGPGIAPADAQAIFEPYRRSDRSGQRGAGLGLALCRAIAKAHGAQLTVACRDGGGSCFTLSLPLERAPLARELP